jgi:hypothetical protein
VETGLNEKYIHKEIFPVYSMKFLLRKFVHNWVEKFSQGRLKVTNDARPVVKVAEATIKRLLFCGFRGAGKAMGEVYQCWWRICQEMIFFQFRLSRVSHFISICDPFTDFVVNK